MHMYGHKVGKDSRGNRLVDNYHSQGDTIGWEVGTGRNIEDVDQHEMVRGAQMPGEGVAGRFRTEAEHV